MLQEPTYGKKQTNVFANPIFYLQTLTSDFIDEHGNIITTEEKRHHCTECRTLKSQKITSRVITSSSATIIVTPSRRGGGGKRIGHGLLFWAKHPSKHQTNTG